MGKKEKVIYCTYFDKGFLLKGLALYYSLVRHSPKANFWILAFDKYTEDILKRMKLKGVTVVSLSDFEDKELLAVKSTRHIVEYYWTCTPSWIMYVMNHNKDADFIVYLDADLYFYSDPNEALREMDNKSLLVVEHRFPKDFAILEKENGRFNVAFNVFRKDKISFECLKRWRKQCLDWCYWRKEKGKLGDQMYLDEWPSLYGLDLVISDNLGLDAAPWNITQYRISKKGKFVYINSDKLICYHFHQFKIIGKGRFARVSGYTLSKDVVNYIYKPYEDEIDKQFDKVKKFDPDFVIEVSKKDSNKFMVFKEKMAKYLGPVYWRIRTFLANE